MFKDVNKLRSFKMLKASACTVQFISSTRNFHSRQTCDEVRVRFAPSPTGNLHLGGLRTALYNFLFARSQGGKFILRIEDTDQQRLVPGAVQQIEATLDRYELFRDEGPSNSGKFGPYLQSGRKAIYRDAVEQLIDSRNAYRCFCTKTRLDMLRREAARRHEVPKYDNHCRELTDEEVKKRLENGESYAVRFKFERKEVHFKDQIFGEITQKSSEGDFILMKTDSFPTYHLANVVDDHHMQISHVIRGSEWLTSVSKHIQLYQAFGWLSPMWIHLPLLVRNSSKKLSKRDKDAFVEFYDIDKGYLPIAVLNYLCRNGSGIQDFDLSKLYTLDEMIRKFNVYLIGKRNIMLDQLVLDAYGHKAIQNADVDKQLVPEIMKRLQRTFPEAAAELIADSDYVKKVLDLFRRTDQKLCYLEQLISSDFKYYFLRPTSPEKTLSEFDAHIVSSILSSFMDCGDWNMDYMKTLASIHGIKCPQIFRIIRLALIDCQSGPPVMELFEFFGKKECMKRFSTMIEMLKESKLSSTL
ncbi:glutamyl-tRNA synthetase [Loa loa]|uniref:Nondiscriminating glutamyl-tRNA synthetase EARS2, mitochondrial n=2 Tax=Loa loa TaxID=7209 RepID=A0A1S0U4T7_LOALO|nr:glutamyl-tRNA synthetase [Loa loa]EFO25182.2 glutamyl-tRNA synthetase [Loa loa]